MKYYKSTINIPHNVTIQKHNDQLIIKGVLGHNTYSLKNIDCIAVSLIPSNSMSAPFRVFVPTAVNQLADTQQPVGTKTSCTDNTQDKQLASLLLCSPIKHKALLKTCVSIILNKIQGVIRGYLIDLNVTGIGSRISIQGQTLQCKVGYSHSVLFQLPNTLRMFTGAAYAEQRKSSLRAIGSSKHRLSQPNTSSNRLSVSTKRSSDKSQLLSVYGIDKNQITQITTNIRDIKQPVIYTGNGISFVDQVITLKPRK